MGSTGIWVRFQEQNACSAIFRADTLCSGGSLPTVICMDSFLFRVFEVGTSSFYGRGDGTTRVRAHIGSQSFSFGSSMHSWPRLLFRAGHMLVGCTASDPHQPDGSRV